MAGKFMLVRKIIIPIMTLVIMASQLSGCAIMDSKEMISMIDAGQSITIEVAKPNYDVVIKGEQQKDTGWVQLDQLKTFNTGFRQGFDEIFNINIVTENKVNGKSGSLYVDESGDRSGNTTIEDAFRNKTFVTKYWNEPAVKSALAKIALEAYTDIDGSDTYAIAGALNAYYNLMPDSVNPSSFNATQSMSREQFYTLVFKSTEGVKEIRIDQDFEKAIGGATEYSKYAQEVDELGFLSVSNKSLDGSSYKGSISRAEAIYMVVNSNFADKLAEVTGKEKAFSDTKNAGDLAYKAGFKVKNKETKEITGKDRWQSYTLAYMLQNPDKGMQSELYNAMVIAKDLGIVGGTESRWDEPISKSEAIQLMVNTQLAKNKVYGYLSTAEYGKLNAAKFKINVEGQNVLGVDGNGMKFGKDWAEVPSAQVPVNPNTELSSGRTLADAKRMIDGERDRCNDRGYSAEDTKAVLTQMAKDLGTTLDEVERLPDAPVNVVKPAEQNQASKPTQQTQPSNTTGAEVGTPGAFPKTALDVDGNGVEDELESVRGTGGGTTVSDPNFNPKAN